MRAPARKLNDDQILQRKMDQAPSDQEAAPFVCPGCYAVGEEPCAPNCIDSRIEEEREERRRRTEECQCGMCYYCDDGQPHRGDRE